MGALTNVFSRAVDFLKATPAGSYPVSPGGGGWINIVREWTPGSWQANRELNRSTLLAHTAVFSCISLIESDISKLRPKLVQKTSNGTTKKEIIFDDSFPRKIQQRRFDLEEVERAIGAKEEKEIWVEVDNPAYSPVLRKPNHFQTPIQFFANWVDSKLIHGNTYVLKERDGRGVVIRLYVLDPTRVQVLISPDGSVYYEMFTDYMTGITQQKVSVPASEIIHDRWYCWFHPLVGLSPLVAASIPAVQGMELQKNATQFAQEGGNPGGIITAPKHVDENTAMRLQREWNEAYGPGGAKFGQIAVLGDGMTFQRQQLMSAVDNQLIEQLKHTSESICAAFHVPPYMVGLGSAPSYNNIEALTLNYYNQCLQRLIEDMEQTMDFGLGLGPVYGNTYGVEFDIEGGLFRMDTATKVRSASESVRSGAMSPDEARERYFGLGPVKGGATPYLQQQNYSLSALDERDQNKPFAKPTPAPQATPSLERPANGSEPNPREEEQRTDNVVYPAEWWTREIGRELDQLTTRAG